MGKFKLYKNLITILILFFVAIFLAPLLDLLLHYLYDKFGFFSAIILGFFYSFSFTGGASAVTLSGVENNFLVFALLSAVGSMLADLTILKIIRTNLSNEINMLLKTLRKIFNFKTKFKSNKYFKLLIGLLIIGSPLPDEIGVYVVNSTGVLSRRQFLFAAFFANFIFIYVIARFL